MIKFLFLFLSFSLTTHAQKSINNRFYEVSIQNGSDITSFKSVQENDASIEGFKISSNGKLKFIIYLMSNKLLSTESPITTENYIDYISDLGDINVTAVDLNDNAVKVSFRYVKDEKVGGTIFIAKTGNVLNRLTFVIPVDFMNNELNEEVKAIFKSIKVLKQQW